MENRLIFSAVYIASIAVANLIVQRFGVWTIPLNAFFLIGLDLTLRNVLSFRTKPWQMGLLIVVAGLVTYLLNQAAGRIAAASSISFVCASIADWTTFAMSRSGWIRRNAKGSVAGSIVDSLLFPTLAFGSFSLPVVAAQIVAKTAGAIVWSFVLRPTGIRRVA